MAFLDGRIGDLIKNVNVKKLTNKPKIIIILFLVILFTLTFLVILKADKRTKEEVVGSDLKVEETEEYNKIFANDPAYKNPNTKTNKENEFLKEVGLSEDDIEQTKQTLETLKQQADNITNSIPALPVFVLLDKETNMYSIAGMNEKFPNGNKSQNNMYLTREQRQALAEKQLADDELKRQKLEAALNSTTLVANIEKPQITEITTQAQPTNSTYSDYYEQAMRDVRGEKVEKPKDILEDGFTLNEVVKEARQGEIKTGFVIPATLLTEIQSALKGMVIGQVRQNVYDTATGDMLLIPQGTKLVGDYQSDVQYGTKRIFVNWKRLVFPNGSSFDLSSMPGADMAGTSGFRDKYDSHFWKMFGNALLFSFVLAGVNMTQAPDLYNQFLPIYSRGAATSLSESMGQSLGETMSQMIRKNLNVAPDITIRAGYLFNIMITKDFILPEYEN